MGSDYKPQGALTRVFDEDFDELIISGPAGTGKTRACLEYMHQQAEENPGFRGVVHRKTFVSLEHTARVTYENWVQPPVHRIRFDEERCAYYYPNGSVIALASVRKAPPFNSCDLLFAQGVTELSKEEWRAAKKNARRSLAECNPDEPEHWVWADKWLPGEHELLESFHEDNPRFYDEATKIFTEQGRRYIAFLDQLTGATKERLRHGRWCSSAAGHLYGNYDKTNA